MAKTNKQTKAQLQTLDLMLGLTNSIGMSIDNDDLFNARFDLALLERGIELIKEDVEN